MKKDSKIYVAGHRGMVGSAICRKLKSHDYHNLITKSHVELDLTCQKEVATFFNDVKPEYVFLAAARVGGILANSTYPAEFIYENLTIQTNVIHTAHLTGVKKLVFLGSSCIYPRNCPQPMKEEYLLTDTLESTNEAYAIAKIAGIKMCQSYYHQYNDNFVSVMPTNLYGPNDNFDLESSHVLPALIRKFHEAKLIWDKATEAEKEKVSVEIWGSGRPYREFLHVDDMAEACLFVMNCVEAAKLYKTGLTHLNIGAGEEISIADLADMIKRIVSYRGTISFDSTKPDGTPRKLLGVERMKALGWQHQISLSKGIKQTYEWYLKEGKK